MPFAFTLDVPANEEIYRQIRSHWPEEAPKGMVAHVVMKRDGGLRYLEVWETEADWQRFRDDEVEPTVAKVLASMGIPHDHSQVTSQPIEVIDTWLSTPN